MAKAISYNLSDVSREQAYERGEVFFRCWLQFQMAQAKTKAAERKAKTN